MDIKVSRIKKLQDSKVKAFVDLIFDGSIIIKGFKIVDGENGLFVSYPSEKAKDDKYYNTINVLDSDTREKIEYVAIGEYQKKAEQTPNPDPVETAQTVTTQEDGIVWDS